MNWYSIVMTALWLIFGFIISYIKQKTTLLETAQSAINNAEASYIEEGSGKQKMSWCVERLYDITPAPLKIIFTKETIQNIVQSVFDKMEDYATKQLDKVAEKFDVKK